MRPPPGAAVLLVGHGSQLSPDSSEPVHRLRRDLHGSGSFPEVRVAFWKEEPALSHAFDLVERRDVFVVPVFMSEGYFTRTVVPRELGLSGPLGHPAGRRVHCCPPVGTSPRIVEIVRDRALRSAAVPGRTDLLVVGHGTDRSPSSGDTTRSVAEALAAQGEFRRVRTAFLDQEPRLSELLGAERPRADRDAAEVVIVPFFVSRGWHVGTTLPRAMTSGDAHSGGVGHLVRITEPVGTHSGLADVVVGLVADKAAEVGVRIGPERTRGETTTDTRPPSCDADYRSEATEAREAFLAWIRAGDGRFRSFMQSIARWSATGGYEVRHARDRGVADFQLEPVDNSASVLRLAGRGADGAHRPLRSAPDLASGWRIAGLSGRALWEVYADLYPGAPVHWHLFREGRLRVTPYRKLAGVQTGIYAKAAHRTDAEVGALVQSLCSPGHCLREPVWWSRDSREAARPNGTAVRGAAPPEGGRGRSHPSGPPIGVPCPRPCAVFLSASVSGRA
ncbi:MAG: DR2241 family protein [Gammaproteobacteria bacterium]|nr:DR2241 family protein [Gammaproteobacteria bacterium]MDE0247370.1 DR2241 family protein [Gammaproteobacteria bacterium]